MIILKQVLLDIIILLETTKSHLLLGFQELHSLSNLLFIIQSNGVRTCSFYVLYY